MRTLLLSGLALSVFALPAAAQDVLLYSNGSPLPAPGLSTGPTTDSGVAAPVGATWSEVQHPTGDTTHANNVAGFPAAVRSADDFTVPAGPGWIVNFVEVFAYQTGSPATPSPIATTTVRIFGPCTPGTVPEAAGCTTIAFGDTTTNRLVTSTDALMFRAFNTVAPPPGTAPGTTRKIWRNRALVGVTLGPGYYWMDWASTATNLGVHFLPAVTVPGSRGLPNWNARQLNPTWVPIVDNANPVSFPDLPQDLPFDLFGTIVPVELMSFEIK